MDKNIFGGFSPIFTETDNIGDFPFDFWDTKTSKNRGLV